MLGAPAIMLGAPSNTPLLPTLWWINGPTTLDLGFIHQLENYCEIFSLSLFFCFFFIFSFFFFSFLPLSFYFFFFRKLKFPQNAEATRFLQYKMWGCACLFSSLFFLPSISFNNLSSFSSAGKRFVKPSKVTKDIHTDRVSPFCLSPISNCYSIIVFCLIFCVFLCYVVVFP